MSKSGCCICRYLKKIPTRYCMSVSVGISLCAGMCQYCRYFHRTDPEIHADTYTYIQYLHIQTYLLIPTIPAYTCKTYIYLRILLYLHIHTIPTDTYNTYSYCDTYLYLQYVHIHAKPGYTDIPAYTCNTYRYLYIPAYNCVYL